MPKQLQTIVTKLRSTPNALNTIDLSGSNLGDAGAQIIAQYITSNQMLRSVNLSRNNISAEGVRAICTAVSTSRIEDLDLSGNEFENSRDIPISSIIMQPNNCVKSLKLISCHLLKRVVSSLFSALDSEHCHLTELEIEEWPNWIQDDTIQKLANSLTRKDNALESLTLVKFHFSPESMSIFANAIENANCKLRRLYLDNCFLSVVSGSMLAVYNDKYYRDQWLEFVNALKGKHCKIESLYMINSLPKSEWAQDLANAVVEIDQAYGRTLSVAGIDGFEELLQNAKQQQQEQVEHVETTPPVCC